MWMSLTKLENALINEVNKFKKIDSVSDIFAAYKNNGVLIGAAAFSLKTYMRFD